MKGKNMRPTLFTPAEFAKIAAYKPVLSTEVRTKFTAPSRKSIENYMQKYIATSAPEKFSPLREMSSGKNSINVKA